MFPAKDGISEYCSVCILLIQHTLDYKKEGQVRFHAYVQAHTQPTYIGYYLLATSPEYAGWP